MNNYGVSQVRERNWLQLFLATFAREEVGVLALASRKSEVSFHLQDLKVFLCGECGDCIYTSLRSDHNSDHHTQLTMYSVCIYQAINMCFSFMQI